MRLEGQTLDSAIRSRSRHPDPLDLEIMAEEKSNLKKDALRKQILDLTAQYYDEAFPKKPFLGGISQIPVSGKVFDGDELKNLVDSSLDFWLTSGRFAH